MIPKIIHFVFGLSADFGGKPFSYLHFLAIYTAWKVNRPDRMLFHYRFEPTGEWWDKARPFLTPNEVDVPMEIFGNPVSHYAHRADIIRLMMLKAHGGIYLDLDVLCINSFDALLRYNCVMGIQRGRGLCNAVILAEPNADFLTLWLEKYKTFDGRRWDFHSVELPFRLAQQHPSLCHVVDQDLFFYPTHADPVHRYLFGLSVPLSSKIAFLTKSILKLVLHGVRIRRMKPGECAFHIVRGEQWHYQKLCKSYCVHLWESQWWNRYLASLTPERIATESFNLARALRTRLNDDESL